MGKRKRKWSDDSLRAEAQKYKTRYEFCQCNMGAYHLAAKYDILDDICTHMSTNYENDPRYIKSLKIVKKCKTIKEFSKIYYPGYSFALENKLMQKLFPNIKSRKNWTNEELKKEALKYDQINKFRLANPNAYSVAHNRGIMKDICNHMKKRPHYNWDYQKIVELAKTYESRKKFEKENCSAYYYANKNGFLKEILEYIPIKRESRYQTTYSEAYAKMQDCNSLVEFKNIYSKEYNFLIRTKQIEKAKKERKFNSPESGSSTGEKSFLAYINSLLKINLKKGKILDWLLSENGRKLGFDGYDEKNKIAFEYNGYWHHKPNVKKIDRLKQRECKKHNITLIVICEKSRDRFSSRKDILIEQLMKTLKRLKIPIKNPNAKFKLIFNGAFYTEEKIQSAISECKTYTEFTNKYRAMFVYLSRHNKLFLLEKLVYDPHPFKVTKEVVWEQARQCSSYLEFIKKCPTAYMNSKTFGIRDEIRKLFPEVRKPTGYWTDERIIKAIKKYKTQKEIYKNEKGAYFAMMKSKKREMFLKLLKPLA